MNELGRNQRQELRWPGLAPIVCFHVARRAQGKQVRRSKVRLVVVDVVNVEPDPAIRSAEAALLAVALTNRFSKSLAAPFSRVWTCSGSAAQLRTRHLKASTVNRAGKATSKAVRILPRPTLKEHTADRAWLGSVVHSLGATAQSGGTFCGATTPVQLRRRLFAWKREDRTACIAGAFRRSRSPDRRRLGLVAASGGTTAGCATKKSRTKFVVPSHKKSIANTAISVGCGNSFHRFIISDGVAV
jgi:hypothetical protein